MKPLDNIDVVLKFDENNLCQGPEEFTVNGKKAALSDWVSFYITHINSYYCKSSNSLIGDASDEDLMKDFGLSKLEVSFARYRILEILEKYSHCDGCS